VKAERNNNNQVMSILGNAPSGEFRNCLCVQNGSLRYRLIISVMRAFPSVWSKMWFQTFPGLDFQIISQLINELHASRRGKFLQFSKFQIKRCSPLWSRVRPRRLQSIFQTFITSWCWRGDEISSMIKQYSKGGTDAIIVSQRWD
jgi:hypothetical protein